MKNRKGLSAVVTTLIIILLVLVAVGIIWVVVRNLIEEGAEQIDINTKCIAVDIRAVGVTESDPGNYSVTLNRKSGGGDIGGVKINLFNDTASSGVIDFGIAVRELFTETATLEAGIINANKMEFTVFFIDASGNDKLCSQTTPFEF